MMVRRRRFPYLGVVNLLMSLTLLSGCGYFDRRPTQAAAERSSSANAAQPPLQEPAREPSAERVTAQRPSSSQRLASGFRPMDLKDTTIDALARIGGDAVGPLVQALNDPEPAVRTAAARALAAIGPEASQATPALMQALDDRDHQVRVAAARALGQIGPAAHEAVPALLQVLREEAIRQRREEAP